MSNQNKLQERLNSLKNDSKTIKEAGKAKAEVIEGIINPEPESDLKKIAEELQKANEKNKVSVNDNTVKDTIYIQEDIYRAIEALCVKRGDKKRHINAALADYVRKKHKELT